MVRVCVVGGGTAGTEAAREAERCGAEVTLVEKSQGANPPWKSWPDLIGRPTDDRPRGAALADITLTAEALSVGPGFVSATGGREMRFDAVVAATGCTFKPTRLPGHRKDGVFVLDGANKYSDLGRHRGSISRAVVWGEGTRALQVADRLCGSGTKVHLLVSIWRGGGPSAAVASVINQVAAEKGVQMAEGRVDRGLGCGAIEAVLAEGKVISCDTLAVLPPRVPMVPPAEARLGPGGGLLVDEFLVTSSPGLLAAGGCAEVALGSSLPSSLENEAAMSGRVAGANSAGQRIAADLITSQEVTALGLRWRRVGLWGAPPRGFYGPHRIVSHRWGPASACTIAFEVATGRVLGIEAVELAKASPAGFPQISPGATNLRALAYGGSSDISLVSDTARLGLTSWQKS
jgi:NADPH-dependent 2,4-dienoyl-CoA reductase/sulfur reductase-like enzyme